MKLKLHIHSDCHYFGGSENMVRVFLMNERLRREFDITFTYRRSPEYEAGMGEWLEADYVSAFCRGFRFPAGMINRWGRRWRPLLALKYAGMLYEVAALADVFRNEKPDVLHVNNGGYPGATSCNAAVLAGWLAGVPRITYMINSTARDLWWERLLTWLVRRSGVQFISASEHLMRASQFLWQRGRGDMAQGLNIDTGNWHVIPNTVLYQTTSASETVRKHLDIDPAAFLFVMAGADEPRKGRDVFAAALSKISKYLNARGWMSDPEKNGGFGDYDLISAADCVVVPSLYDEDFPNVILIAMMYGKPVIASDVGGIAEAVEDQVTGYVMKPGNVKDLMTAMIEVQVRKRKEVMGENGKRRFDLLYSENVVIDQYVKMWRA